MELTKQERKDYEITIFYLWDRDGWSADKLLSICVYSYLLWKNAIDPHLLNA